MKLSTYTSTNCSTISEQKKLLTINVRTKLFYKFKKNLNVKMHGNVRLILLIQNQIKLKRLLKLTINSLFR